MFQKSDFLRPRLTKWRLNIFISLILTSSLQQELEIFQKNAP